MAVRRSHPWRAALPTNTPTHPTTAAGTSPRSSGGVHRRGARPDRTVGSRRNGDRTGPVARTRRHGDRTGQIPIVPAAPVEEPLIDPYDFGFDDVGYGPDQGIAGKRIDSRDRTTLPVPLTDPPEPVEQIELDEHPAGGSRDPVSGPGRTTRAGCGRPAAPPPRRDRDDRCAPRAAGDELPARLEHRTRSAPRSPPVRRWS